MPKAKSRRDREQLPAAVRYRCIKKSISIEPKTPGQAVYLNSINTNDITICNGVAGTGKTLLAVGAALKLMHEHPEIYSKLIMIRPYVGVPGEDIGYLPGDANDKLKPFMVPLYDSLGQLLTTSEIQSMSERGVMEVIPVTFMRGRTLANCVIIFDEAQNSRWEHMKMFLTRIGFNAKVIIEGDISQSDLDRQHKESNGLKLAIDKLSGVQGLQVVNLVTSDIVRSPIVKRILEKLEAGNETHA